MSEPLFKDHFSTQSATYALYRPSYPKELFVYLASVSPARTSAWDCATGNGQAATGLACHFQRVVATDASSIQISNSAWHPRIDYVVIPAEKTNFPDDQFDLITVAAALHWLKLEEFYAEVRRTLKPGGVFAAWMYDLFCCPEVPQLDDVLKRYYHDVVGAYWPPERRHIETGYENLSLPYPPLTVPRFAMTTTWTREHVEGYLLSWSASQYFFEAKGYSPIREIAADLDKLFLPEKTLELSWPLTVKACRKPA